MKSYEQTAEFRSNGLGVTIHATARHDLHGPQGRQQRVLAIEFDEETLELEDVPELGNLIETAANWLRGVKEP